MDFQSLSSVSFKNKFRQGLNMGGKIGIKGILSHPGIVNKMTFVRPGLGSYVYRIAVSSINM
jgi:hypothetical protein